MPSMYQKHLRPLLGSRSFYRETIWIMLPVAGQQMISSLFGFIDSLMVGMVDAATLSGVTVANKMFFVYSGFFWGITGAGGLLISQYFGADDQKNCQRIFLLQQLAGILIGLFFTTMLLVVPELTLRAFVEEQQTIAAGMTYLEMIRFSYLPAGISMVSLFSLRAVGQSRVPLIVGFFAIGINVLLNWVFIFGNLGLPAMGARGAGLATLLARLIEMGFYLVWIGSGRTYFSWRFKVLRHTGKRLLQQAGSKTVPLIANEFLYTMGTNMYFWAYARLDETAVPALAIAEQSMQFIYVLFSGVSAAVSIMIGSRLGAGKFEQARDNARKMLFLSACLGVLLMLVIMILSGRIPGLFNVSGELQQLARLLILIQALFFVPNMLYSNIFFILRAGGDIRSAFRLDALYTWLIPIPVTLVLVLAVPAWIPVSIVWAYLFTQLILYSKLILAFKYIRRGHWIRNLTAEKPDPFVVDPAV